MPGDFFNTIRSKAVVGVYGMQRTEWVGELNRSRGRGLRRCTAVHEDLHGAVGRLGAGPPCLLDDPFRLVAPVVLLFPPKQALELLVAEQGLELA